MPKNGIAIDIGTSGLRAQSIDLSTNRIIGTAITMGHPIPGANVMDHLDFAIDTGASVARNLIMGSLNRLLERLHIDLRHVERVAVCGNPIQLSLFQDIEIRDLAYSGERAKKKLGVDNIRRDSKVVEAGSLNLNVNPEAEVFIPPAVKHEIGADALAMMYKTDFLTTSEIAMVTDYGTNAEMALKIGDDIITGSAAAGPAIEGQHVKKGMLAAPGAISDISPERNGMLRTHVLDRDLLKRRGALVDPDTGEVHEEGDYHARGITGTGVIALVSTGIDTGLMSPGKIHNSEKLVRLQKGMDFSQEDLREVGKTIAAFTAGHMTLTQETGISLKDIKTMYMTGASGTYVDAMKAMKLGLVPGTVEKVMQVGNTSLALACDIVRDPGMLDFLQETADSIRAKHLMFAESKVFENAFAVEMGVWVQGMPFDQEAGMLKHFGLEPRPPLNTTPHIVRILERDIHDLGVHGLTVMESVGTVLKGELEGCTSCRRCIESCNEDAITIMETDGRSYVEVMTGRCMGTACRRCERACKSKVLKLHNLHFMTEART